MPEFLLRPVQNGDSQALIQLIGSCYSEYPNCVLELENEEKWLKEPASYYNSIEGVCWVVELAGKVCACVGLKFYSPRLAEPKTLYVAKYARKRGLATFLMGFVEGYAKLHGIKWWSCWSDTRFTDAHRLYIKLGYTKTGRTRELHDLSNTVEFEFVKELRDRET